MGAQRSDLLCSGRSRRRSHRRGWQGANRAAESTKRNPGWRAPLNGGAGEARIRHEGRLRGEADSQFPTDLHDSPISTPSPAPISARRALGWGLDSLPRIARGEGSYLYDTTGRRYPKSQSPNPKEIANHKLQILWNLGFGVWVFSASRSLRAAFN